MSVLPPLRDRAATSLPLAFELRLDWRALLFASASGFLAAVGAGIVPAWRAGREGLYATNRIRAARRAGARPALVVCRCAMHGAACRSRRVRRDLPRLRNLDPGFDAQHVATLGVDPDLASYTPVRGIDLQRRLVAGVRRLGVEASRSQALASCRGRD